MTTLKKTLGLLTMTLGLGASVAATLAVAADHPRHGDSHAYGFGRCSRVNCECGAFRGRRDRCSNCGHTFITHY